MSSINAMGGSMISGVRSMMTRTNIMIAVFVIILIGVGIYYYRTYYANQSSAFSDNSVQRTDTGESAGDAEIILFHVDWCPHCKTAKPEWDKVRDAYEETDINGYDVVFTEVNCTEESPEVQSMIEKYNIEGYPTIKLIKGDQVIDFEAKPTESTITQFLKTVL